MELLILLALPVVAFWVVHFIPLSQNGYLDPYIYTGYINNFQELVHRYGATYYGVRFGLILPGQVATAAFGSVGGYFALRYVLVLAAGLSYWMFIKQRYGRAPAYALLSVLLTSPFLARTVLWDHPDAAAVPFLLIACALFLYEPDRLWRDLVVGVCGGMAIHSNAFVIAPLTLYLGAYAIVWLISGRPFATLARRLGLVCLGVLVVTAAGVAYYGVVAGRWDIFTPTVNITTWLVQGGTRNWRTPGIAWMADMWWVLTPVVLLVMGVIVTKGRKPPFPESVIILGGLFTTALLYVHQFLLDGNSLQLHYYFSYALPAIFLLLALIIGRLWQGQRGDVRVIAMILFVLSAAGPWILYSFGSSLLPATFRQHLVVVTIAVVCVAFASWLSRWRPRSTAVATIAIGVMFVSCFARPMYASMINSRTNPTNLEMNVYRLALQLMKAVPPTSEHPGAIRFWYSNIPPRNAMQSIQSTYLWGYSKVQGDDEGLPHLGPAEMDLIRMRDVTGLILLAENPNDVPRGREALRQKGVDFTVVDDRILTAESVRLYFERLALVK